MAETKRNHAVYDLTYHIIFVTKYRRPVLSDEIGERLKTEITRLINEMKGEVKEIETDRDHVHILASLSPREAVTKQINVLKGVTARILRRDYGEELSQQLWGDSLWSESYYIATAGGVTIETLEKYVRSQKNGRSQAKICEIRKIREKASLQAGRFIYVLKGIVFSAFL